jgi:peptide/nickel transport system substrate-binding protein
MNKYKLTILILLVAMLAMLAACASPTPTLVVSTRVAPTAVPPTVAPTAVPATSVPATSAPVAAAPTVAPTAAIKAGGSLTYVLNQPITTLDPGMIRVVAENLIAQQIYDQLLWLDQDQKLQAGLATTWKINQDYTVYDLELRKDVKFHDGTPFNAEAVVAWFNRVLNPNYKIGAAVTYFGQISKVEKTGDYAVRITLKQPSLSFLKDMAQRMSGIGSPTAAAKAGDQFGVQPVGTGPFIFKEYLPGSHVKLVKNPDYKWGPAHINHTGAAYLDDITFRIIPEDAARTAAIESGNAQIIARTAYVDAGRLGKNPKYKVLSNAVSGVPQMNHLNVSIEPTNDLKVRQAILYATDTTGIVKTVYFGLTMPAFGPVNQWNPAFEPKMKTMYPYNPDKAKQLLTDAGWKPGADGIREKDGKKLTVVIGQNQGFNEWVEFLQANLKAVGFDAKISTLAGAANNDRGASCKEAMPSNGGVNYDALGLTNFFSTRGALNWSCLKDAKLEAMMDEASTALDQAKRDQRIKDIQVYIMENAYMLPIVEFSVYTTMQSNVQGIVFDATGFYPWLLDVRFAN